jgi:hypothetical protein
VSQVFFAGVIAALVCSDFISSISDSFVSVLMWFLLRHFAHQAFRPSNTEHHDSSYWSLLTMAQNFMLTKYSTQRLSPHHLDLPDQIGPRWVRVFTQATHSCSEPFTPRTPIRGAFSARMLRIRTGPSTLRRQSAIG